MGFDEWELEHRREMLDVLKHVMPLAVVARQGAAARDSRRPGLRRGE
jgi:hypothetical protein